jgi:hypothetical protein
MTAEQKQDSLGRILQGQVSFSESKATLSHYASLGLMATALGCTLLSAILGIFTLVSSKIVGGLAALPAIIAFIAVKLKLDTNSYWHYRKAVNTRVLYRRLMYECPDPLTHEYVEDISAAFNSLDEELAKERERTLKPDWSHVDRHLRVKEVEHSQASSRVRKPKNYA